RQWCKQPVRDDEEQPLRCVASRFMQAGKHIKDDHHFNRDQDVERPERKTRVHRGRKMARHRCESDEDGRQERRRQQRRYSIKRQRANAGWNLDEPADRTKCREQRGQRHYSELHHLSSFLPVRNTFALRTYSLSGTPRRALTMRAATKR